MAKFRKALAAAMTAAIVTAAALADGTVSADEVGAIVVAWCGVIAVWAIPNKTATP